jgi:hypothetical protein
MPIRYLTFVNLEHYVLRCILLNMLRFQNPKICKRFHQCRVVVKRWSSRPLIVDLMSSCSLPMCLTWLTCANPVRFLNTHLVVLCGDTPIVSEGLSMHVKSARMSSVAGVELSLSTCSLRRAPSLLSFRYFDKFRIEPGSTFDKLGRGTSWYWYGCQPWSCVKVKICLWIFLGSTSSISTCLIQTPGGLTWVVPSIMTFYETWRWRWSKCMPKALLTFH